MNSTPEPLAFFLSLKELTDAETSRGPFVLLPTSVKNAKWYGKLTGRQKDCVAGYLSVVAAVCWQSHVNEIRSAADANPERERELRESDSLIAAKVSRKQLERLVGRNDQAATLKLLVKHGVIEVVQEAVNRVSARVLKLTRKSLRDGFSIVQPQHKLLREKLSSPDAGLSIENPTDTEVAAFEQMKRIEVDLHAAIDAVSADTEPTLVRQLTHAMALISFVNRTPYLIRGKKSGRLFSNITNLKRELREHLRVDGEPLTEIDLPCSQAIFLANYVDDWQSDSTVRKFAELACAGELYRFLADRQQVAERLAKHMPDSVPEKAAKKAFFCWLFCDFESVKRRPPIASAIDAVMKIEFETVWRFVHQLKGRDHKQLAQKLQKIESELMIGHVLPTLMCRTFAATIHDSCLVKASDAQFARGVIANAFEGYTYKPPF